MNMLVALLAAVVGYAFGSISFARLFAKGVASETDLAVTEIDIPGSEKKFELKTISATSIMLRRGARYGCFTSIFDMLKATLPVLAFRLLFPEQAYYLIAAVTCVIGHNYPVQHGFKGGRGMSPILGSLLAIDWLAIPVVLLVSNVIGLLILRDILVAYTGFVPLLIPWFFIRSDDPALIIYAVTVNIVFWIAIRPELFLYIAYKRAASPDQAVDLWKMVEGTDMGRHLKYLRRFGLAKGRTDQPAGPSSNADPQD